jgi:tetratricopeptide (TPR) repeat protein/uncharacterized protein YjbI with pentapeptide repeats
MSLLLDALKKAAEKKARKSQQDKNAQLDSARGSDEATRTLPLSDDTDIAPTQLDATHVEATEIDATDVDSAYEQTMEIGAVAGIDRRDATELDATELESTHLEATELDATELDSTHLDATELEATELESTHLEATELDATELESTHLEATELDATELESTHLEATELDATELESTHLEATELDATELESTHLEATELDATELESTHLEATELDATELESTHLEATQHDAIELESTHLDATRLDATELESTHLDATQLDATELEATHLDATDIEMAGHDRTELEATELDATDIDSARQQVTDDEDIDLSILHDGILAPDDEASAQPLLGIEDTDSIQIVSLPDADATSTITRPEQALDGADEQLDETDLDAVADDATNTQPRNVSPFIQPEDAGTETLEMKPVKYLHELGDAESADSGDDLEPLTIDDVTEFMGDGLHADASALRYSPTTDSVLDQDDTTLTNSESLSLTNFEEDSRERENTTQRRNDTQTRTADTQSIPGYSDSDESISFAPGFTDDDMRASASADGTGTVDIEKLTNDETVTLKETTGTRTFAPDNYDRTLLKLADQDVSRIFPGMKSDSNAVMTPDYAKKVFINKSQSARRRYYRYYIGLGVIVLAVVLLWGMEQVQQESNMVDDSLVRLRKDPHPGEIRTRLPGAATASLSTQEPRIDSKALEIIARAEDADPIELDPAEPEDAPMRPQADDTTAAPSSAPAKAQADQKTPQPVAIAATPVKATSSQSKSRNSVADKAPQRAGQAAPSQSLSISSSNRIDEKDRLLGDAYAAYQAGDFERALGLYTDATRLEPQNRDALLGLAAIHVRQGRLDQAIDNYREVLLANPKDSVALTSLISVINVDPAAGETEIKKLLSEQPKSAHLHFALGNMYGSQKRWQEAQTAYFEALKHKPDDPNYAYNLAVSLEHIEKPRVAATFYRRALDNLSSASSLAVFDREVVSQRIQVLNQ